MPKSLIAGCGFIFLGFLAAGWIVFAGIWAAQENYMNSITFVAREIKDMNPEQWRALGIHIPELRIYPSKQEPVQYLEDTEIRMDYVQAFIKDSDEYQFAPERLYGEGTRKRTQWLLMRDWLIENEYLIANSNAGNHTWLWRTGRRILFMRNYLGENPLQLINLNEEEEIAG